MRYEIRIIPDGSDLSGYVQAITQAWPERISIDAAGHLVADLPAGANLDAIERFYRQAVARRRLNPNALRIVRPT